MGASVREIDRTYRHLVRDSDDAIRAPPDARAAPRTAAAARLMPRRQGS
jgi:hypothetical protein